MSINIQAKSDVSYLFSSLGSGAAGVAGSNLLADYASIKNGSYAKLMKAYYSENASDTVKSVAKSSKDSVSGNYLSKEESGKYAQVQTTSDALKEAADALLDKSLFEQKAVTVKNDDRTETVSKAYDTEKIYKAVDSFVSNYNSVVKAAAETEDASISRRASNMVNTSLSNSKALSSLGITFGEDGTLSLNKDTFMKADMTKVKSLFYENGSYGYQVSAQASLINYAADNVINKGNTYTVNGSYTANFSNGNLFSTYF